MVKENFDDYLQYNQHYNNLLIQNFLQNESLWSEKSRSLLNHIINAQQIWNARILNENQFDVWQINGDNQLLTLNSDNFLNSSKILESKQPDEIISYQNSKGERFQNSVREIFFHFINHSTYHRGQLAMLMKQAGMDPINTDYIFYKRL